MDKFNLQIESEIFRKIFEGKAEYLILLNNAKNSQLKQGNIITLVDQNDGENFDVRFCEFYYFNTIKELFYMINKEKCGYSPTTNVDIIEDKYVKMFNDEKIDKYGVVAVKVSKIN